MPPTIWSARMWIAKNAWIRPKTAPEIAAIRMPSCHELSLSAPRIPKKQPDSIIPSRPMFTTPLRSAYMPPIAAKAIGVPKTNMLLISTPQSTTPGPAVVEKAPSRWSRLEMVAP